MRKAEETSKLKIREKKVKIPQVSPEKYIDFLCKISGKKSKEGIQFLRERLGESGTSEVFEIVTFDLVERELEELNKQSLTEEALSMRNDNAWKVHFKDRLKSSKASTMLEKIYSVFNRILKAIKK